MSSKESVIIFGGLGYVGDPLIRLLRENYHVTVVDPNWFENDIRYKNVIYDNRPSFDINVIHADYCIYLAAVSNDPMGQNFASQTYSLNQVEALRIASLCATSTSCKRFIFASSCSVYGSAGDHARRESDPLSPITDYAQSKVAAEEGLKKIAGDLLQVVCLRFATACGASGSTRLDLALNDFVITALDKNTIQVLSDGEPWRPFIHIMDMALAMKYSITGELSKDFEVFNVGSEKFTYRIGELAKEIAEITKSDFTINTHNVSDKRSYTVDFTRYKSWYNNDWPTMNLQSTVEDLTSFYFQKKEQFGDNHFNKFRESLTYCRLKMLKSKYDLGILKHFDD